MNKYFAQLSLIAIFLTACGSAEPLPPPSATVTQTITLSQTPRPTQTDIPTATPYSPLQTDGPYLLFTFDNQNSPLKNFTIMDADGSGRKQFQLPNDGYIRQLNMSVSPDGKQLAYFTGSIEEPYDITLNLLNLSDGTTRPISNLLAPNFPANVEPIVKTMVLGDPPIYDSQCFGDMECRTLLVQRELTNSIFSFDWSPDSQSIAFAAQMESPSSNIYIYTLGDKTIHQLTHESENIYWLDWAPNGERILYEICSTPGMGYEGRTLHVTDLQGITSSINDEHLYRLRWGENDWLTEDIYLLDHPNDTDEPPIYDLMTVNTETRQFEKIWPYSVEYFAIDKENQTIVLIHKNHPTRSETFQEGIYIVDRNGNYSKISDVGYYFLLFEGQKPYPIFLQDYNDQIHAISDDGSIKALPWSSILQVSPNGNLFLIKEAHQLVLYDDSYRLVKSWEMADESYDITWSPDSLSMFIFTNLNVYHLAVSEEEPHLLIENCPTDHCKPARFVWLP